MHDSQPATTDADSRANQVAWSVRETDDGTPLACVSALGNDDAWIQSDTAVDTDERRVELRAPASDGAWITSDTTVEVVV